jgi:hypothetical protein
MNSEQLTSAICIRRRLIPNRKMSHMDFPDPNESPVGRAIDSPQSPCYGLSVDEAKAMAEAGADVVVTLLGLTTKEFIRATTATTLEERPAKV